MLSGTPLTYAAKLLVRALSEKLNSQSTEPPTNQSPSKSSKKKKSKMSLTSKGFPDNFISSKSPGTLPSPKCTKS